MGGQTVPGRRRLIAFLPVVVFLVLAGLLFLRLFAGDASVVPSALIGRPAPQMDLAPLEGLQGVPGIAAADLKAGQVTVVNIFASWCAPCRAEHPLLLELAKVPDVRLVGINQKDNAENARRFLGALGNPYRAVGVDPNGRVGIEWGVYGVPETFIVDGKGVIRHKHIGPLSAENIGPFLAAIEAAKRP